MITFFSTDLKTVDSKPEIFIAQTIYDGNSSESKICYLKKDSTQASLIKHAKKLKYNFKNNLAYNSQAQVLYAVHDSEIYYIPINGSAKDNYFVDPIVYTGATAPDGYRRRKRGIDWKVYLQAEKFTSVTYDWATHNLFFADGNNAMFITRDTNTTTEDRKFLYG